MNFTRAEALKVAPLIFALPRLSNMRRLIPSEPTALAPEGLVKSSNADTVLNTCNMAGQLGLLQQLGWLASYSHEVFGDLTREAEASYGRVVALKHRLHRVTERLARVDDAVANANEEELAQICATNQPQEFKVAGDETSNLFTPHTRPAALQATLEEAQPPPKLEWMDQFVERDASANPYHKYGLHESCMTHFSDQDFFVKQFLDEEEKKVKKLKEERRARREQRRQREGGGTAKPMYAKGAKRVKKKREDVGVGLYTVQQQLAKLQMQLESTIKEHADIASVRVDTRSAIRHAAVALLGTTRKARGHPQKIT